jgi:pyruvate formate lyase activating enzyme
MAEDPIEKKPLYHYRPGSVILSLGFAGCNMHCPFCQNWHISQGTGAPGRYVSPEELIGAALSSRLSQIAYTYSEPLIHAEFLIRCMELAREAGLANVLVSNGCIRAEAAADIIPLLDAANIDLKSFSQGTYSRVLGGDLGAVLAFIRGVYEAGVHLEVTTLIVPGLNDSPEETEASAAFLASLDRNGAIPWHLSAYHPDYRWDAPPTDPALLEGIARRARRVLPYVYTGNIAGSANDTPCPHCGATLVERRAYRINTRGLVLRQTESGGRYHCAGCGKAVPLIRN